MLINSINLNTQVWIRGLWREPIWGVLWNPWDKGLWLEYLVGGGLWTGGLGTTFLWRGGRWEALEEGP